MRTFEVPAQGPCSFEVAFEFTTLDDIRIASLELRRNVSNVNATLIWLCVMGAIVALVVTLVSRRRSADPEISIPRVA